MASSSFLPWGLYSCSFFLWDVLSVISPLSPWHLLVSPLCGDSDSVTSVTWLSYCSWPELSYPNCSYYAQLFPKPVLFNFGFVCLFVSFAVEVKLYGIKLFQVFILYTLLYSWCYTAITSIQFQGICALEKTQLHSATTPDNSPSFLAFSVDLPSFYIFMQMALDDLWLLYSLLSLNILFSRFIHLVVLVPTSLLFPATS